MLAKLPEAAATMTNVAALSESMAFLRDGFVHEIAHSRERFRMFMAFQLRPFTSPPRDPTPNGRNRVSHPSSG